MAQLDLFDNRPTLRQIWERDMRPDPLPALTLNPTVPAEDVPRLTAALQRLHDAMRGGEWFTSTEMEMIAGRRYGARLEELNKAGIPHESERLGGGEWRYRLIGGDK